MVQNQQQSTPALWKDTIFVSVLSGFSLTNSTLLIFQINKYGCFNYSLKLKQKKHPWINYEFCVVSELLERSWKDKQRPSVNLNIQLWLLVSDSLDLISFCSFCYNTDWKLQLGLRGFCLEIYTEVDEEKGSQMVSNKILSVMHSISSKSQKLLKISSFSDISLCLSQPSAQACS